MVSGTAWLRPWAQTGQDCFKKIRTLISNMDRPRIDMPLHGDLTK